MRKRALRFLIVNPIILALLLPLRVFSGSSTQEKIEKTDPWPGEHFSIGTTIEKTLIYFSPTFNSPVLEEVGEREDLFYNLNYKRYPYERGPKLDGWWSLVKTSSGKDGWIYCKSFVGFKIDFNAASNKDSVLLSPDRQYAILVNAALFSQTCDGFCFVADVWLIKSDFSSKRLLLDRGYKYFGNFSLGSFIWTPNGKWIIHQGPDQNTPDELFAINPVNGRKMKIANGFHPTLIEKQTVLFYERRPDGYSISEVNADGSKYRSIFSWRGGCESSQGDGIACPPVNYSIKDGTISLSIEEDVEPYYISHLKIDRKSGIIIEKINYNR